MAPVGTRGDSTENLVQKRDCLSVRNLGMGDSWNACRCSRRMLEVLSRTKAKLVGALCSCEDGDGGLQPWWALGSAQVSPSEEDAFPSTKQHLTASVPIWNKMVTLSRFLVANLSQSPSHLQSVSAALLGFSTSRLQGCHFRIQRTVTLPCRRPPCSPALNKLRPGAVQQDVWVPGKEYGLKWWRDLRQLCWNEVNLASLG